MCSRFTEHFNINEPWELCQSEPSSPSPSSSTNEDSFFSSSTETLNFNVSSSETLNYNLSRSEEESDFNNTTNTATPKNPFLMHTHSFTSLLSSASDNTNTNTTKKPMKSKLKRFLTTIRRQEKS